jgi:hypothetical protein
MSKTLHGMTTGVSVDGSAVLAVTAPPPDAKIGIGASWLMPVLDRSGLSAASNRKSPASEGLTGEPGSRSLEMPLEAD